MKKIIYSILLCTLSVVANLSQAQSTNVSTKKMILTK